LSRVESPPCFPLPPFNQLNYHFIPYSWLFPSPVLSPFAFLCFLLRSAFALCSLFFPLFPWKSTFFLFNCLSHVAYFQPDPDPTASNFRFPRPHSRFDPILVFPRSPSVGKLSVFSVSLSVSPPPPPGFRPPAFSSIWTAMSFHSRLMEMSALCREESAAFPYIFSPYLHESFFALYR